MGHKVFYTPGEFAKLFQIDKQTLIYYDNQGIFSPAHKSENGYRYYSTEQILPFAELVSLRNLHVGGSQMAEFNATPTREKLLEILCDKAMEYEETMASLQETLNNLHHKINQLKKASFLPLHQVMLIPRGTLYFQRSPLFEKSVSFRDAFLKSAPLTAEYATHLFDKELQFAIAPEVSSLEELECPYAYRTLLLSENEAPFSNPLHYDPSIYLTLIIPHALNDLGEHLTHLKTYMDHLHLQMQKQIFLSTIIGDERFGSGSCHYFTKIEIAVTG